MKLNPYRMHCCVSTVAMVTPTRLNVMLYVHRLSCLQCCTLYQGKFNFFVGNVSGDLMSDGQQCPALRNALLITCAAQKTPEYILIRLF
jgi:hypothetical protein